MTQLDQMAGEGKVLHLFSDSTDTVVAADMADAQKVWAEQAGDTYEDACGDLFEDCWYQVGDDEVITIRDDEGNGPETKRAKEWAASHGRGFLCSTEY